MEDGWGGGLFGVGGVHSGGKSQGCLCVASGPVGVSSGVSGKLRPPAEVT